MSRKKCTFAVEFGCKVTLFFPNSQIMRQKNDQRLCFFIQNLGKKDRNKARNAIIRHCNVTYSGYYSWMRGIATPTQERMVTINGIAFLLNQPIVYEHEKGYQKQAALRGCDI